MHPSRPHLAKGFLARSYEEIKRLARITWNLEGVKGPQGPRPLYSFTDAESVSDCLIMCDDLIGGSSESNLDFVNESPSSTSPLPNHPTTTTTTTTATTQQQQQQQPSRDSPPSTYARFHGTISTALPRDLVKVKRSGYAAFRTPTPSPTILGPSVWDVDPYRFLALRVKSDGRAYLVNVQTDGAVDPTNLHQHRLFARRPGRWETVLIRWNDFVRTSYGFAVEPQSEMLRQRVTTIGLGLTDRVEGPFELCIERIWATSMDPAGLELAAAEEVGVQGGGLLGVGGGEVQRQQQQQQSSLLKTKKGENIRW